MNHYTHLTTNERENLLFLTGKGYSIRKIAIDALSEEDIAIFFDKLNKRPRKCLGWKTPFEVFYKKMLHLV